MIHEKIGYIVGQAETGYFAFVSDMETYPPKHEYILVKGVKERRGDEFISVDVLAQVSRISNRSDILSDTLSLDEVETIIGRYSGTTKVFGEAKVFGYIDEKGDVIMPRSATVPGQAVAIAPNDLLERFFTKKVGRGIHIGGLITRDEVNVQLDPNGFRRHVAVIAQTGAGKSYLVGLVLEKLLPQIRISASAKVMIHPKNVTVREIIHRESSEADIVFLELDPPEKDEDLERYAERLVDVSEPLRTVFFVKNSSLFVGKLVQTSEEITSALPDLGDDTHEEKDSDA